jgi:hypothetical protein
MVAPLRGGRLKKKETMQKYGRIQRKPHEKKELNPIWRGIGCILSVIVPLMSYGLMILSVPLIIATGKVPYQILGRVHFPDWVSKVPILGNTASFIGSIDNLWMNTITFFVMVLLLTALSSLVYSMVYAIFGPARYSSVDAPPPKVKVKKYTR